MHRGRTVDIEGYVFDGADGCQVALWTCKADRVSTEHAHDFDDHVVVLKGRCAAVLDERCVELVAGQELHVPKGTRQAMEVVARTHHARLRRQEGERENER